MAIALKGVETSTLKQLRIQRDKALLPLYKKKYQSKKTGENVLDIKDKIHTIKETYKTNKSNIQDSLPKKKGMKGIFSKLVSACKEEYMDIIWLWSLTKVRFPRFTQFFVFFMISNVVTLLQLVLMPLIKSIFEQTPLIDITFQWGRVGTELDGSPYYMFNYVKGLISEGGGGGLGYFLAIQITLAIAQVINFFAQRNITFKNNGSVIKSALWYVFAYVIITLVSSSAQGLYKKPIYTLFMTTFGWGATGEMIADVVTMIIYSAISFWVFYPIFKVIFRSKPKEKIEG